MKKHKLNQQLHYFLTQLNQDVNLENKNILVACSGGVDSMAVLHLMNEKKNFFKMNLHVVFFQHLNSPICDGEDKNKLLVENFCQKNNLQFHFEPLNLIKKSQKSWEELGRNGRRDFYQKDNFDFVFLGHHRDDQNETTLLQMFRGGGRAIAGMKERTGKICRPFLSSDKADFIDYLNENKIKWIDDPTNKNIEFTRNFIRNEIIPKLNEHYPQFSKIMDNFRQKMLEQQDIILDVAIQDGIHDFLDGKTISVAHLSHARIKNVFNHIFSLNGSYIEQNKLDDFIFKSKKISMHMNLGGLDIFMYQGNLSTLPLNQKFNAHSNNTLHNNSPKIKSVKNH